MGRVLGSLRNIVLGRHVGGALYCSMLVLGTGVSQLWIFEMSLQEDESRRCQAFKLSTSQN